MLTTFIVNHQVILHAQILKEVIRIVIVYAHCIGLNRSLLTPEEAWHHQSDNLGYHSAHLSVLRSYPLKGYHILNHDTFQKVNICTAISGVRFAQNWDEAYVHIDSIYQFG